MVFEPLSAFAVACNVVQVVEVGVRALVSAAEYRAAADGALKEHNDLHRVLQSLQSLSDDLQASLSGPASHPAQTAAEARLVQVNEECFRLSKDFIDLLNRLKVKNHSAMLENIRMSLKSLWYKDKLAAMEKSVSQSRNNLHLAFLMYMQ